MFEIIKSINYHKREFKQQIYDRKVIFFIDFVDFIIFLHCFYHFVKQYTDEVNSLNIHFYY
jgi:hypothetical protein